MARQGVIMHTFGNCVPREYIVTYQDDSPERAEAVAFFRKFEHGLFPVLLLREFLDDMPYPEAQRYLDEHPQQEQWSILTIRDDAIVDDDLARLEYLPELEMIKIDSNRITDRGICHLKWLTALDTLILYSNSVTDACLESVKALPSLRCADLQSASRVTPAAYQLAMDQMPQVRERYPPFQPPPPREYDYSAFDFDETDK